MEIVREVSSDVKDRAADGSMALLELLDIAAKLSGAGRLLEARDLYVTWIAHNEQHPLLYVALFNCSSLDGQLGEAVAAMERLTRAVQINPDFLAAYVNLGGFYERAGLVDKAIELWLSGVARPLPVNGANVGYVTTLLKQAARVLSDRQEIERAEGVLVQCLAIDPTQVDVMEQALALRLAQCKWPIVTQSERLDRETQVRGMHPLSMAVYTDDPILQLAGAERYVRTAAVRPPMTYDRRSAPIDLSNRRLRVGYVSSDLRDHAIGYLMANFFELHDKSKVEIFAYYCGTPSTSDLTNRIKAAVEHWADITSLSDDEAAALVAADEVDILVDVNGHTRDARPGVFARRPAPVIVNWLGFPGTMGTPYHHYIVADDFIIPPGSEKYYSEAVVRLPCYQPNDRKRLVAETPTRESVGLPDDAFVYCCFNGVHKVSRFTFDRWMTILKRVPGSVLWLLECSADTKKRLAGYAQKAGVSAERIVFAPKMVNPLHLARYPLADVFLDTAPYGAHTTASDALWMGVPVITHSGRGFAARVCGSLVRAAGLPELVFDRPEEYVECAVALGHDPAAVAGLKARLLANRETSVLFDTQLLVGRLEAAYLDMCAAYVAGELPQPDLANLPGYLDVGVALDHEATEMLAYPHYLELYRARLAAAHMARPISGDRRFWSDADARAAERGDIVEPPVVEASVSGVENDQRAVRKVAVR